MSQSAAVVSVGRDTSLTCGGPWRSPVLVFCEPSVSPQLETAGRGVGQQRHSCVSAWREPACV